MTVRAAATRRIPIAWTDSSVVQLRWHFRTVSKDLDG